MCTKKYNITDIMTVGDAAQRYNVSLDKIKNRLKPSKVGKETIEYWIDTEIIRMSQGTWLVTTDFMDMHFKTKRNGVSKDD